MTLNTLTNITQDSVILGAGRSAGRRRGAPTLSRPLSALLEAEF